MCITGQHMYMIIRLTTKCLNASPLSKIQECFDNLAKVKYIYTLDSGTGYWQVMMCAATKITLMSKYPLV